MRRSHGLIVVLMLSKHAVQANLNDLEAMFDKIEMDTRNFARYMETLIMTEKKCSSATERACMFGNYDDCTSEYPEASCPGNDYALPVCGDGKEGSCGALFDFTASTVRLAPTIETEQTGNPKALSVQETICSTLPADDYMREETVQNSEYWSDFSVSPPAYLYGADNGVFRIFPGNPHSCPNGKGDYDPRIRPWYVSASSGPKDIVFVLDTSGSMSEYGRMDTMKGAVIRAMQTLGFTDYVSVVEFNTNAKVLLGVSSVMVKATDENKDILIKSINELTPGGRTDFYKGFSVAFDVLKRSIDEEFTSSCHKAIMFLTDGEFNSDLYTESDFFSMIEENVNDFIADNEVPPVIFSYSFGGSADETIPKQLACEHDGVWAQIEDDGDLAESMGGFYKYFAYGLGDEVNEDFVAWVSPYEYSNGIGLGTTASAPVYDRSVDPPVLAGVVGEDFSFLAMERALGSDGEEARIVTIEKLAERSKAQCPNLQLSKCQLESLRYWGGSMGSKGLCHSNTSTTQDNACALDPITSTTCDDISRLDVWNNHLQKGRSYTERVCCNVGEKRVIGQTTLEDIKDGICTAKRSGGFVGAILGIFFGGIIGIMLLLVCHSREKKKSRSSEVENAPPIHTRSVPRQAPYPFLPFSRTALAERNQGNMGQIVIAEVVH